MLFLDLRLNHLTIHLGNVTVQVNMRTKRNNETDSASFK